MSLKNLIAQIDPKMEWLNKILEEIPIEIEGEDYLKLKVKVTGEVVHLEPIKGQISRIILREELDSVNYGALRRGEPLTFKYKGLKFLIKHR